MFSHYLESKILYLNVLNICKHKCSWHYCPETPSSYRLIEPLTESIKEITVEIVFLSMCLKSGSPWRTCALISPIKQMNILENTQSSKTQQCLLPTFILVLVRLDISLSDWSFIWKQLTPLYQI